MSFLHWGGAGRAAGTCGPEDKEDGTGEQQHQANLREWNGGWNLPAL
jgi:hypothetical protein